MGRQTSASGTNLEPSSAKTANGTSTNRVRTKAAEHLEVYVRITAVGAGQIDSIAVKVSDIDINENPNSANDFDQLSNPSLNLAAVGTTLVGSFSRTNGNNLGLTVEASWELSGSPNITFSIIAVIKE